MIAFFLVKKEAKKLCLAANYFLLKECIVGGFTPKPPERKAIRKLACGARAVAICATILYVMLFYWEGPDPRRE